MKAKLLIGTVLGLIFIGAGVAQAHPVEDDGGSTGSQAYMWTQVYFEEQPPKPASVALQTMCHEDEVGMVMRFDFEPDADDRGFYDEGPKVDGNTFYRLCVPLDDLTLNSDGHLVVPGYDD